MLWGLYTGAAFLTLAWLALAAWALFADRARGRRRCPKCFFSLEGLDTLRCPECGRTAKSERHLHRTRRRWGVAIVGAVLLLTPAAATAWLARVQQAGAWADVPTSILITCQVLGDKQAHAELITRIQGGDLTAAQARRVVLHAISNLDNPNRRENAYTLLEALGPNSWGGHPSRRPGLRPRLEELAAPQTTSILLERFGAADPTERARILALLSHLRDADERANLTILAHLVDDNSTVAEAAQDALQSDWPAGENIERLPYPPDDLQYLPDPGDQPQHPDRIAARWISSRIADLNRDPRQIADFARSIATGSVSPPAGANAVLAQATAIWLWCRLDRANPECLDTVARLAEHQSPILRSTALEQLPLFQWSDRVEALLRHGLREPWGPGDRSGLVPTAASASAAKFGLQAQPLAPDFLEFVARLRRHGRGDLPEDFVAIGGEPQALLDAIVQRLERITLALEGESPPEDLGVHLLFDFLWVADLNIRDQHAAEVVRWFIDNNQRLGEFPQNLLPILAYAALTGDKQAATRMILGLHPILPGYQVPGNSQQVITQLINRELADPELLADYFLTNPDTRQPSQFLGMFYAIDPERIGDFEDALSQLAKDNDPSIAGSAQGLLDQIP